MTLDDTRAELDALWEDWERRGEDLKDPYYSVERLEGMFRAASGERRAEMEQVFCEWVFSDDEAQRMTASGLLLDYRVQRGVAPLRARARQLADASTSGCGGNARKRSTTRCRSRPPVATTVSSATINDWLRQPRMPWISWTPKVGSRRSGTRSRSPSRTSTKPPASWLPGNTTETRGTSQRWRDGHRELGSRLLAVQADPRDLPHRASTGLTRSDDRYRQTVSLADRKAIIDRIVKRSGGIIHKDDIGFIE